MAERDAYQVLAERHGYPNSARYRRILEFLMTPQQAGLVAELPKTPEELAAKLSMDVPNINRELDILFRKGVVIPKNFETLENCRFARSVMQLHDATMSHLRLDPTRHSKLFELWYDFGQEEWDRDNVTAWSQLEQPPSRILPAYKSVLNSPQLLPYEDVREILRAAPLIAVVSCTCRQEKEAVGRKCQKSHDANCIQFGRSAEYAISRGSGTKLSFDEALAMVDEVEADALVHTWGNTASMYRGVMCNCCGDCCVMFEPLNRFQVSPTKYYAKSRYEARVDQGLCDGCQICVDRCQFDAIQMEKPKGSKKYKAVVDLEKCMGCGVCVLGCDPQALSMELVRPPEHIPGAV